MREIKFRAQCKLKRKWMYGSYRLSGGKHYINSTEVYPETLGEYVEYLDAYEGDLLIGSDAEDGVFYSWYGEIKFDIKCGRIRIYDEIDNEWYEIDDFDYERVSGNIHDNPELIDIK